MACPFGSRFEQELEMLKQYEPNLYKAALNVFGCSIEYTRTYREYKAEAKRNVTELDGQMKFNTIQK